MWWLLKKVKGIILHNKLIVFFCLLSLLYGSGLFIQKFPENLKSHRDFFPMSLLIVDVPVFLVFFVSMILGEFFNIHFYIISLIIWFIFGITTGFIAKHLIKAGEKSFTKKIFFKSIVLLAISIIFETIFLIYVVLIDPTNGIIGLPAYPFGKLDNLLEDFSSNYQILNFVIWIIKGLLGALLIFIFFVINGPLLCLPFSVSLVLLDRKLNRSPYYWQFCLFFIMSFISTIEYWAFLGAALLLALPG